MVVAVALAGSGCNVDADGDGYGPGADCDDSDPTVYPGGLEYWDRKDNDCDGAVDVSPFYRWLDEVEPNDSLFDTCGPGSGQWLGTLAPLGFVSYLDGRIDTVVDEDYDRGDMDCFGFFLATDAVLHLQILWPEPSADLDFVVWSEWEEGAWEPFIASFAGGPFADGGSSNGSLSSDAPIYLWLSAYEGEPTEYEVQLWTTWATGEAEP